MAHKYAITKGPSTRYDNIVQNIVGIYDTYSDALEQIPYGWVVDDDTDADQGGEMWYAPDTDESEMDGYCNPVSIVRVD